MANGESVRHSSVTLPKGLIVDDDPQWRRDFSQYLLDAGLSVTGAESLQEAERLLSEQFFHVAMVDLSLFEERNRDGQRIMNRIHDSHEGCSALLITAYGDVEDGAEAVESHGAFKVLSKSKLRFDAISSTIAEALNASQRALAAYSVGLNLLAGHGEGEDQNIQEFRILTTLGQVGQGHNEINQLTVDLLAGIYPILRHRTDRVPTFDDQRRIVSGRFWSKMLGAPFTLLLGREMSVAAELNDLGINPARFGIGSDAVVHRRITRTGFTGAVLVGNEPSIDQFELQQDHRFRPRS